MPQTKLEHNAKFATSCWITNGEVNRRVQKELMDQWLGNGYRLGKIQGLPKPPPVLCFQCGEKPLSRGAKKYCSRDCANAATSEARKQKSSQYLDPDGWARYIRARRYGLSLDDLDALIEVHDGICAICKESADLVVDHCHKTGKVRGLLCWSCNSMLGFAKDNPQILENAKAFLQAHA